MYIWHDSRFVSINKPHIPVPAPFHEGESHSHDALSRFFFCFFFMFKSHALNTWGTFSPSSKTHLLFICSSLGGALPGTPAGDPGLALGPGLTLATSQQLSIGGGLCACLEVAPLLEGKLVPLVLQGPGGDQPLDLGGLGPGLGALGALLEGHLAPDDVLPDIVILGQVEQLADVVGPLGSQPVGHSAGRVGDTLDLLLSLLDDDQVEDGRVRADNAAAHRLAAASSLALLSVVAVVARVSCQQREETRKPVKGE